MKHSELIRRATQALIDHTDELTALDQAIGDGDHGLNMRRGAQAIQAQLASLEGQGLSDVLKRIGMTCVSTIGGASGPVFGTLLMTLAKDLPAVTPPAALASADVARALAAAMAAVSRLGKAQVGQKTLLDVLAPVQALLADTDTQVVADEPRAALLARVRACADESAAATAQMNAERGRASFLGERALGHVDPGSRSMALIIGALCDALEGAGQGEPQ